MNRGKLVFAAFVRMNSVKRTVKNLYSQLFHPYEQWKTCILSFSTDVNNGKHVSNIEKYEGDEEEEDVWSFLGDAIVAHKKV